MGRMRNPAVLISWLLVHMVLCPTSCQQQGNASTTEPFKYLDGPALQMILPIQLGNILCKTMPG